MVGPIIATSRIPCTVMGTAEGFAAETDWWHGVLPGGGFAVGGAGSGFAWGGRPGPAGALVLLEWEDLLETGGGPPFASGFASAGG